jgi:glutamine amidotransferase
MLAILDYEAGNLTSVKRALDYLSIPCAITADKNIIAASHGLIFPGVGAAGSAMNHLHRSGLREIMAEEIGRGTPMLGICLGCQILLEYSLENDTTTLGLIPGRCDIFTPDLTEEDGAPINIPHMGWNTVRLQRECRLFEGVSPDSEFYFVHSYYPAPAPEYTIGTTYYGREFCSVHGRDGLWATQFHPEKSGRPGLKMLSNFYAYCREVANAQ